jgi:deoxyribodipyrimidine photo-lyase
MNVASTQHVIWWLKKDFRLSDNPALTAALNTNGGSGQNVVPIFIIEPSATNPKTAPETSAFHVAAWLEAVKDLRKQLKVAGGDLCILHGEVVELFAELKQRIDFTNVVSHEEVGTHRTFQRDKAFAKWCKANKVTWQEHKQTGVFRGFHDRDKRASVWSRWMSEGPLPPPKQSALKRLTVPSELLELQSAEARQSKLISFGFEMDATSRRLRQKVSESAARETLDSFLNQRGIAYSGGISSPNSAFTAGSRLSVHFAWGTITGREVYAATDKRMAELKNSDAPDAGKWRRSLSSFKARLHWRDHFTQRLETEPTMEFHPLNRAYDKLPTTRKNRKHLKAWCDGETGFPMVDACVRCARTTGFLNFRMRSMITSVACHALRLDWRDIMWPMAAWWADYEPGIHLSQLQMQAGVVGINTLRTYNPAKQIADHDPRAKFIKRWVPELKPFSADEIIAHQDSPIASYVAPLVDWKASTTAMRSDYYTLRREPATKALAVEVMAKHGSRKRSTKKRKSKTAKKKKADNGQMRLKFE